MAKKKELNSDGLEMAEYLSRIEKQKDKIEAETGIRPDVILSSTHEDENWLHSMRGKKENEDNERDKKNIEGMDENGSDEWYHTEEFDMFKNDEKTTKAQGEFLISIGYKFPELNLQEIIDKNSKS